MLRVGGGYSLSLTKSHSLTKSPVREGEGRALIEWHCSTKSPCLNKCSNCEFSTKELQKCKEQLEEERKKNMDLEEKITVMIEEQALEELNVMNKLDQVMNLVKSV